jgi:hypothetical protein
MLGWTWTVQAGPILMPSTQAEQLWYRRDERHEREIPAECGVRGNETPSRGGWAVHFLTTLGQCAGAVETGQARETCLYIDLAKGDSMSMQRLSDEHARL